MFESLKEKITSVFRGERLESLEPEEYIELEKLEAKREKRGMKVLVRKIEEFADTDAILNHLREGNNIIFINIKPLAERDRVELRRAIGRLKKTCKAIDGDIVGVEEDWIIVTPAEISIAR